LVTASLIDLNVTALICAIDGKTVDDIIDFIVDRPRRASQRPVALAGLGIPQSVRRKEQTTRYAKRPTADGHSPAAGIGEPAANIIKNWPNGWAR
jgi:hypothetical protein